MLPLLLTGSFLKAQTPVADSLKKCLLLPAHDTVKVKICTQLSTILLRNRYLPEATRYAVKARDMALKTGFDNGYINAIAALASCYTETSRFDEAVVLYVKCINHCKKKNNTYGEMNATNKLGLLYFNSGQYKKALVFHMQALKMAEKTGNSASAAMYLSNISRVYSLMDDYRNAITYAKRALKFEKDPENIIIRHINLSNYYIEDNQAIKAIEVLQQSLRLNDSVLHNSTYEAYLRHNLGLAYFKSGKFGQSIPQYLFARKVFDQAGDVGTTAQIDINLAFAYERIGNRQQALVYLANSLRDTANSSADQKKYIFEVASILYENAAQFKNAIWYARKSMSLRDSLFSRNQAEAVAEMQTRYESEKKQDSLVNSKKRLEAQQEINRQITTNSKQKSFLLLLSVIFIALLVFLVFLVWFFYRRKKAANTELIRQKKLVEEKNRENEILLGEIHHRVKNNLQVISSLLSLQGKNIEDKTARMAIEEGKQRVRSMELVHKMLYEGHDFASIEMVEFTRQLVNNLVDSFGISRTAFRLDIASAAIRLDVDTAVPLALIINEVVVNSLKHAFDGSLVICLSMAATDQGLNLEIADNGKGADPDVLRTSESFGLKLVKLLTRQLNGRMEIFNENGLRYNFMMKEYKLVNK